MPTKIGRGLNEQELGVVLMRCYDGIEDGKAASAHDKQTAERLGTLKRLVWYFVEDGVVLCIWWCGILKRVIVVL